MLKKEIEKLVEDQIKDAKLELWQKWFKIFMQFGGAIIVVFGLILPIWTRIDLTGEVKEAIQEMETKFEKLAGTQLREPEIKVYLDGQEFKTGVLTFVISEPKSYRFLVSNVGDRIANSVSIRLYTKSKEEINFYESKLFGTDPFERGDFEVIDLADEKDYSTVYQLTAEKYLLQPGDSFSFDLSVVHTMKTSEMETSALLKIIYDREPLKIPFEIVIEKK